MDVFRTLRIKAPNWAGIHFEVYISILEGVPKTYSTINIFCHIINLVVKAMKKYVPLTNATFVGRKRRGTQTGVADRYKFVEVMMR